MSKKAIIIFSGGLDSTTCLYFAKQQGFDCYAITFDYGQKAQSEILASKRICKVAKVIEHKIFNIDIAQFKGSALTDSNINIPKNELSKDIPITYVPARNTIFLSIALGWAETLDAFDIFIGVNQLDYSGYPDCRDEYIKAFEKLSNLATKKGVESNTFKIHTPLLRMNKSEIIKLGMSLGVDYNNTVSCYDVDVDDYACGICESCILRKNGFDDLGITDPIKYLSGRRA